MLRRKFEPILESFLKNNPDSINLGTVYEAVVARELHAHGFPI